LPQASLAEAGDEKGIEAAFAALLRISGCTSGCQRSHLRRPSRQARRVKWQPLHSAYISFRDFAAAGGLMSYDPDIVDAHRRSVSTLQDPQGRLPPIYPSSSRRNFSFHQPQDSKTPASPIPPTMLARADEVIE